MPINTVRSPGHAPPTLAAQRPGPVQRWRWRPLQTAAQGIKHWWESRLSRSDTHLLTQRNVYILPTRAGFMFALTLLTLLLASINYQLNLGYVLTFLLAGSGVVSMHLTHNTLRGLQLHLKPVAPVFAGESALIEVVLAAPARGRHPRYGIGLRCNAAGDDTVGWVDVPAGGQVTTQIGFVPALRGVQHLPTLAAHTRFPLGLFRAWTVWRPAAQCLVYPRLEQPPAALPLARSVVGTQTHHSRAGGSGDTDGVRGYRRGDPPKMVVWKKAAKALGTGGELLSRDTSTAHHQDLWLDWHAAASLAPEDRLSRLAAWVVLADRSGLQYGLKLPGSIREPDHGDGHRRACLEALALWQA